MVDAFGEQYPKWIDLAKIMHGSTFDPADYPEWQQVRSRLFGFNIAHVPVPHPQHFNPDMQKLYGAGLEILTEKKLADGIADAWKRLVAPVQAMAEKLSSPDAVFRDTLVENVKDMLKLVPDVNITNDPDLKQAADAIAVQLANLNPDTLRDNKVERQAVAEKAKALAERFGAMGARKLAA